MPTEVGVWIANRLRVMRKFRWIRLDSTRLYFTYPPAPAICVIPARGPAKQHAVKKIHLPTNSSTKDETNTHKSNSITIMASEDSLESSLRGGGATGMDEDEILTRASASSSVAARTNRKAPSKISSMGRGVCRIETTKVEWDVFQPWHKTLQSKSSGTGFCIPGERILTNAHVVRLAVDIRIRLFGSTRRHPAKVIVYAPEVDLALLELEATPAEKASFFYTPSPSVQPGEKDPSTPAIKQGRTSIALEFATDLPALQDTVQVVGYPTGGKTICVTEGVVSRIDVGGDTNVVIQVDSAINPGNSGGPALNHRGQVTGVAFRKRTSSKGSKTIDNIGYLIPSVVVQGFLTRIQEPPEPTTTTLAPRLPSYALDAALPYTWHSLENHSLRLFHKVPDDIHGILITSVCESIIPDPKNLQKGDILTMIDGHAIADDGQVCLRGDELIQHTYWIKVKSPHEPVRLTIYRDGSHQLSDPIQLRDIPYIIPRFATVDYQPNYLILGACVFMPLSRALRDCAKCGHRLTADALLWAKKWPNEWENQKELVILSDILAHELTFSYKRAWRRVLHYNDTEVVSLDHLRQLWEASCAKEAETKTEAQDASMTSADGKEVEETSPRFVRLELEHADDLIFEVAAAKKAQAEVMKTYSIPKSSTILPKNPNYRY